MHRSIGTSEKEKKKKAKFPGETPHLLPQHGRMTKRSPLQAVGEPITGQHLVLHLLQRGPANSLPHPLFTLPRHGDVLRLPPAPSPGLKGASLQTWFPKEACTLPAGFSAGDTLGTPGGGRGVQEGSTFCRTGPPGDELFLSTAVEK